MSITPLWGKREETAVMTTKDDDIRDKIKVVINKLDKMEARVKDVENVAASVQKIEAKLTKIESRVERVERVEAGEKLPPIREPAPVERPERHYTIPSTPPPVKAFVSGASIGFLIIGAIVSAWLLGFFVVE